LLCSDGFYDVIDQREYAAQLTGGDPNTLSTALASLAEQRGTTDNVSAVVLVARPSRATEQRVALESTIAEQKSQGNTIVVAVVLLFVVIAIVAAGLYFLL
jgi:serine/threonine protein phosphatase PrpC